MLRIEKCSDIAALKAENDKLEDVEVMKLRFKCTLTFDEKLLYVVTYELTECFNSLNMPQMKQSLEK